MPSWPDGTRWEGFQVAINVSGRELSERDISARVLQAAGEAAVAPSQLVLDITEEALIEGGAPIVRELHRLGDAGVGLAIHDFGTGDSSLGILGRFPVDTVKIDRSIVAGLGVSRYATATSRPSWCYAEG